jgi:hypothetical protein
MEPTSRHRNPSRYAMAGPEMPRVDQSVGRVHDLERRSAQFTVDTYALSAGVVGSGSVTRIEFAGTNGTVVD